MAVILLEDFNDLAAWTNVSGSTTIVPTGRTGQGLQITGTTASLRYAIPASRQVDTITMGFAVNIASRTNRQSLVQFCSDAGATVHTDLSVSVNGALELALGQAGGSTIALTNNNLINAGTWYYVEVQVKLHDTAGTVIITIDGTQRANLTAKDTRNGGTKTVYDQIRLGPPNTTSGGTVLYDDMYIAMGADAFLGSKAYSIKDLAGSSAGISTNTASLSVFTRRVHGIMCVYLGDCEIDIGKTARWLQNFCDTVFFFDASPGTISRQYVIDYAQTWPDTKYASYPSGSTSYFVDPKVMRQAAFQAAKAAWGYDPSDWVFYCDASESLTIDVPVEKMELQPSNPTNSFKYLFDEMRAATGNSLAVPVRIFLNQGEITEKELPIDIPLSVQTEARIQYLETALTTETDPDLIESYQTELDDLYLVRMANNSAHWTVDPHYLALTGTTYNLVRMIQGRLPLPSGFDYAKIDTYGSAGDGTVQHVALACYAYARYSEVDYHDPTLWTRPN